MAYWLLPTTSRVTPTLMPPQTTRLPRRIPLRPRPPVAVAPPPASNGKIVRAVSSSEKPVFKGDDSDPWSKTSLIGKIFIAFGSLLTLASAARLFIA